MTRPELRAQLQEATGERIAALEGIGEMKREAADGAEGAGRGRGVLLGEASGKNTGKDRDAAKTSAKEPDMPIRERGRGGMDLGL